MARNIKKSLLLMDLFYFYIILLIARIFDNSDHPQSQLIWVRLYSKTILFVKILFRLVLGAGLDQGLLCDGQVEEFRGC